MASLNRLVDERFWTHRQRSTSLAGIATGVTAIFVNGKAAILDGKTTGTLAGAVIKHPPTPGTCS